MTRRRAALLLAAVSVAFAAAGGATWAAFTSTTANSSSISAAADFTAPTVTRSTTSKSTGYSPDYIKQGGSYYVYAQVTDSGNPASGVSTVTADASQITVGSTAVPLVAGSYSVGGQTYNYRTALQTAAASIPNGTKTFSITATDAAGNSSTSSGLVVNIDNILPTIIGGDVQAANVTGGTASRMEANDTLTLKFGEQMDPDSILSTWTGASLSVTVRVINNASNDQIQIWNSANTTQAALGTVSTNGNFVSGNVNFTGSTMVQSAGTLTITLGTPSVPANLRTVGANTTMTWAPSTSAYDRAGNAFSTAFGSSLTETGTADIDF